MEKVIIILSLYIYPVCFAQGVANQEGKVKEPYYTVGFNAVNCFINICVNDVSVFSMNIDGQVSTRIPINNAILKSGSQQVRYRILPSSGELSLQENTIFKASVWLCDAGGDYIEQIEELNVYEIPKITDSIPVPSYQHETSFVADVPFDLSEKSWLNSADLNKIDGLRDLVDKTYKKLEDIFVSGQYAQFIQMIAERENNLAISMYLDEQMKEARLKSLLDTLQSGDFKLVPTSPLDTMVIFGNGKLVKLTKPDGSSAFVLINPDGDELSIELKFHLREGSNELTII